MPTAEKNAGTQVDGKPETTTALARRDERCRHRRVSFQRFADPQDVMLRLCGHAGPLLPRPPPTTAPQGPGADAVSPPVSRFTRRAMGWSSRWSCRGQTKRAIKQGGSTTMATILRTDADIQRD